MADLDFDGFFEQLAEKRVVMTEEETTPFARTSKHERTVAERKSLQERAHRLVAEAERLGLTALVILEEDGKPTESVIVVDEVTGRVGAIDLMMSWVEMLEAQARSEAAAALGKGKS